MAELIFYTNPMSRGRIIRWMLEETGCEYDTEVLDYESTMKAPAYLAINPMGKVPAIKHRDQVVTECAAICAYLADAFPEAGLAPPANQRARYYRWLFFAAGPLEHAVLNRSLGFEVTPEQGRTAGYGNYDLAVDAIEAALADGEYIASDRFSAADVYVGAQLSWGLQFNTIPTRERFKAYVDRLVSRDAYVRATEKDDALLPA